MAALFGPFTLPVASIEADRSSDGRVSAETDRPGNRPLSCPIRRPPHGWYGAPADPASVEPELHHSRL